MIALDIVLSSPRFLEFWDVLNSVESDSQRLPHALSLDAQLLGRDPRGTLSRLRDWL